MAVVALLVLPSFWDWNGEKGRLAALVKQHTGRGLEIAGDVSLRLLPTPAFSAEQVTLANLEGGSEPVMARLEELRISIALLPLLRGEVLERASPWRSEEHPSELQSLMRISYAVFCW